MTLISSGWQMAVGTPTEWIDAPVPGTAAQALRDAGRYDIANPTPLHDKDVFYRTRFAGTGRHRVRFGGLATIAEVRLNGAEILRSDNMFLSHDVDVDLIGDNELLIVFRSLDRELARHKGRARWRTKLVENNALRLVRTTLLGHMTGWQPAVHAVGPWRPIELVDHRIELSAHLDGDDGILTVVTEEGPTTVEIAGHKTVVTQRGALHIPKVEKWWPHTHGTPTLHQVRARIGEREIDLGRVGFRKVEFDGNTVKVNGVAVFARGACWSASDLVTLAGDRKSLAPWLTQARDAHMNMIRVGGTMVYESEDFFALCDELGILIWHDFMFANMDYPIGDAAFRASVEREAEQFLERTRHHPSLAVLCGGSEVAQQAAMLGLPPNLWTSPLYEEVLPQAVAAHRSDVVYLPHSPGGGDLPFATDAGVSHYYGVGAYRRPLEDVRRANVRFTSECLGFANLPNDDASWDKNVPRDRGTDWDFADVRDHYLRLLGGVDAKRLKHEDLPHYLELSRETTAAVMEQTIAEWRRPGSSCAGALVWMLKDFVPGAGWGVIGADGVPKLAWHALRRAFRPVQVALTDEGLNGLGIHLINDTPNAVSAKLRLQCFQGGKTVVMRRERDVLLLPRGRRTLTSAELIGAFFDITYAYRFGPPSLDVTAVTLEEAASGARLSEAVHFPLGRGALTADAGLSFEPVADEGGGRSLRIRAARFASCVQIDDPGWWPEDEGFSLLPGEERVVRLRRAPRRRD